MKPKTESILVVCWWIVAACAIFTLVTRAMEPNAKQAAPVCKTIESRRVACLVVSPDGTIAEAPLAACGDPSTEAGKTWCSFRWAP